MTSQALEPRDSQGDPHRAERAASEARGWIGKVLRDGWRIDAKIARGGVATVYRASKGRDEHAAIKILHPEFSTNEDVRQRFLQEGHTANAVEHPGVVRVLSTAVADEGSAYLVMELLDGILLEDRRIAEGGILPLHDVQSVGEQLLDVLAAAHEKGIVHRDVKPENLFLLQDATLKVLDFGMAHMKQTAIPRDATSTGQLLGTPEFMAPEQALGKRGQIDAQTDLWAVGATLFMLLSGKSVHDAATVGALLMAAASRPARSLGSVAENVPAPVVQVVDRALALEKHKRWPNARSMKDALREAIARVSSSRSRAQVASAPTPSSSVNDKNASKAAPGSDPTMTSEADDNPWDDDDGGGRTLATDGPSFEMPSNIPSPITVPPPPIAAPANEARPPIPKVDFTGPMPGLPGPAPAAAPPPPAAAKPIPRAPAAKPFAAAPLGGGTLQASPAPPSSPDLSAAAAAAERVVASGPGATAKHAPFSPRGPGAAPAPPAPPRPLGAAAGAPRPGMPPSSNRMPIAPIIGAPPPPVAAPAPPPGTPAAPAVADEGDVQDAEDDWGSEQQDDGPTMAVASPALGGRPVRDDIAQPRAVAQSPAANAMGPTHASRMTDKDADTMASETPMRASVDPNDVDETTRAVSRDQLIRHQDAQLIVGADAIGDEATLALAPGSIDLGAEGGLAAALVESIRRESSPNLPNAPQPLGAFPAPPQQQFQNANQPMPGSQQHVLAGMPPPSFPYGQQPPQGAQQPPPMFQQGPPPSASFPTGQGAPQPNLGPQTNPMMGPGGYGGPQQQQHQHQHQLPPQQQQTQQRPMQPMPGQPPAWMTPPTPPTGTLASRFTPQVIMLVVVGAVCLAIFIIGIVLFVTTKF